MAITYDDNSIHEDTNPNSPVTFNHTVANQTNRLLIISVFYEHSSSPRNVSTNGVTYDGTVCSKVDTSDYIATIASDSGYTSTVEMYYLLAPSVGTNTVSVTFDSDDVDPNLSCVVYATSYYNVKQSVPESTDTDTVKEGDNISCSITPGDSSNLCFSAVNIGYESNTLSAGVDDTVLGNAEYEDLKAAVSYEIDGTSGGETMAWSMTGTSQRMVMIAATWQEVTVAPGKTLPVISNISGATASGSASATISAFVDDGSGNVWFYWQQGDAPASPTISSNWSNCVSLTGEKVSGNYVTTNLTGLNEDTSYSFSAFISSATNGAGQDWFNSTDTFRTIIGVGDIYTGGSTYDITISGITCSINCGCSRWDIQNYNMVIETWLKKADLDNLRDSVKPGAFGTLYTILGRPHFYDKTWSASNTLRIIPVDCVSNINLMRSEKTMIIKNITEHPIAGASGWIEIKLEGVLSGSQDL